MPFSPLTKFNVLSSQPGDNENGLLGRYTFGDGTAQDSSGNCVNGSLAGSPKAIGGIVGNAISLDGSTQYAVLESSGSKLIAPAITICCWVNMQALSNAYSAVISRNSSGSLYQLFVKSTGKIAFYIGANGIVDYDGTGTNTLTTGKWYHLAGSYSVTNGGVGFVNGAVDGTFGPNGSIGSTSFETDAGRDSVNSGRVVNGYICDVRIYGRELSRAEINSIYNQGLAYQQGQPEGEMPVLFFPSVVSSNQSWGVDYPTLFAPKLQNFQRSFSQSWPEYQEPTQVQPEGWAGVFPDRVSVRKLPPHIQPVGVWPELQEPTQVQPEGWAGVFPETKTRILSRYLHSQFGWPELQEPTQVQPEGWYGIFPDKVSVRRLFSYIQPVGVWPERQEPTQVQPEGWAGVFPETKTRILSRYLHSQFGWPELQEPTQVQPEGWAGVFPEKVSVRRLLAVNQLVNDLPPFPYATTITVYPEGWYGIFPDKVSVRRLFSYIQPVGVWPERQEPTQVQPEGWAGVYPDRIPAMRVNAAIQFGADSWSPFVVPLPPPVTEVHFRYFFADVGSMMTR